MNEIRRDRQSHVLYMPQYAEPWKHRILQSTLDAIRDYPHFPEGSRRWDQRVYHPDGKGGIRPLSELWTSENHVLLVDPRHPRRSPPHGSSSSLRNPSLCLGRLRKDACRTGQARGLSSLRIIKQEKAS